MSYSANRIADPVLLVCGVAPAWQGRQPVHQYKVKSSMFAVPFLALAAALASPASPAPAVVQVPQDHGAQNVVVMQRIIPVGGETGWHTHPGYEICHVVSGEVLIHTANGVVRVGPGETSVIARGAAHNAVNVGKAPAVLAVTFVVDRDKPTRTAAAAPHG